MWQEDHLRERERAIYLSVSSVGELANELMAYLDNQCIHVRLTPGSPPPPPHLLGKPGNEAKQSLSVSQAHNDGWEGWGDTALL